MSLTEQQQVALEIARKEANASHVGNRIGSDIETLKRAFLDNLFFIQGKPAALATKHDYYMATRGYCRK